MIRTLCFSLLLASFGAVLTPTTSALADDKAESTAKAEDKTENEDDSKEAEAKEDAKEDDSKAKAEKDDAKKDDAKKKDAKKKERKTAKVEQKPLKVYVSVDGVFVAQEMTPVALRPETWASFKIEEIVPHGTKVRQGETLVKFDADKLNEEIESLELSQRLSELALRKAEEELPRLEQSLEMSLTDAEQSNERIKDDYARYKELDRDRYIKSLKMSLKMSKQQLDYAKDELEQLEKMYEADDLTEETEEIILTRTKQQVELAEYFYERAQIRHDEALGIYLPRQDEDNSEVVDRVKMSLERAKLDRQIDLNKARYELEQMKVRREKSLDRHAELLQDRALMELKSPAAGIVYYGQCNDGKWSDMSSMLNKLKPHNSVSSGTVMMTIVEPEPMYLLATVGEKERPTVEEGQPAKIRPAGEGAEALEGSVKSVSAIPVSSGKFQLEVELTDDDAPEWLVPGMTGKIKVTTYDKKKALVVDKKAVHSEEDDEDEKYVWLVEGEDDEQEVEKQRVKVGKSKDDLVEILDGLDEGDVVSLEDEKKRKEEAEKEDEEDDD